MDPLREWAERIEDNRLGPLLRELGDALDDTSDPVLLGRVANVLRYMSGSANTLRQVREKERKSAPRKR